VDDGTAAEQEDNEGDVSNVKGNDWVASIVSGLIVGGIVALAGHFGARSDDTRDQVIALRQQVATLVGEVKDLKGSPYIRREEFDREFARLDQRLGNIERAVVDRR
jgi:hypothetical protein